jgi:hypothetical protein
MSHHLDRDGRLRRRRDQRAEGPDRHGEERSHDERRNGEAADDDPARAGPLVSRRLPATPEERRGGQRQDDDVDDAGDRGEDPPELDDLLRADSVRRQRRLARRGDVSAFRDDARG